MQIKNISAEKNRIVRWEKWEGFLDTYKGYNWIHMQKVDDEKTCFHTNKVHFVTQRYHLVLKMSKKHIKG